MDFLTKKTFIGIPRNYALAIHLIFSVILAPLMVFDVVPFILIIPYWLIAWVYGYFRGKQNPEFFRMYINKLPNNLRNFFEHWNPNSAWNTNNKEEK